MLLFGAYALLAWDLSFNGRQVVHILESFVIPNRWLRGGFLTDCFGGLTVAGRFVVVTKRPDSLLFPLGAFILSP